MPNIKITSPSEEKKHRAPVSAPKNQDVLAIKDVLALGIARRVPLSLDGLNKLIKAGLPVTRVGDRVQVISVTDLRAVVDADPDLIWPE